jgi:epoxyqueuosine reductase
MELQKQYKNSGTLIDANSIFEYQYRTLSVAHLPQLQEDITRLDRVGLLSNSEVFRSYLSEMTFTLPQDFPDAQSLIIMAIAIKPMSISFQTDQKQFSAAMPPNYYESGLTRIALKDEVQKKIIKADHYRIEWTYNRFHGKLLATRSGLGRYGRNNICYVDGMGSYLTLHSFLTDYAFSQDDWQEIQMMDLCQKCTICMQRCPGGAIRTDQFVVDIKRCITLYNEVPGELPDWMPANAHNSVMGCMICQASCPVNREPGKCTGQLDGLTQEETRQFLNGNPEESVVLSVSKKMRIPYLVDSKETVEVISRNMKAIIG